ncbi:hypothetical protein NLU13_7235 [Sarocladium strictum]|uniref:Complex 1 LYR protein domain-containing protein n=1 Tax=Sarocladium strictum TaxID=5046 RepID=A0AA39GCF1_SARSR|nr:hypothetical protein NLU13_7235 [Sarocladium strictum]
MRRTPFIPGYDQRHRKAVLALYRTLLREAQRIPLPEPHRSHGAGNSISCFIRQRFASNRPCTSSRLVYAALASGYQFIDVLVKAQCSSSPEHSRLLSHLQSNPIPSSKPRTLTAAPPIQHSFRPGLLTKVLNPDGTHEYVPTKPPSQDPRWITRRLPCMGRTSEAQTFLRFRKPQPAFLTRKLIKQRAIGVRTVEKSKEVENELMDKARDEDVWEDIVRKQMRAEGIDESGFSDGIDASYRWSVATSRLWYLWKWERTWYDLVAKGNGYQAFLDEVIEMKKAAAPAVDRPDTVTSLSDSSRGRPVSKVKIGRIEHVYPLMEAVKNLTGSIPSGVKADPFVAPYWGLLVENQHRKLIRMLPSLETERDHMS